MAEILGNSFGEARDGAVVVNLKEEDEHQRQQEALQVHKPIKKQDSLLSFSVPFLQKLMAEIVGTFFLVFAGCASIIVNTQHDNIVTLPGIAAVWGLTVMVLIYSLGHISGAHLNPAITIAFASCRRFPIKQVPAYMIAQVIGATLSAVSLRLVFGLDNDVCSGKHDVFIGNVASGSNLQALVMEFICTFFLMFVTAGVATDNRAIGELAGLAIGAVILLEVLITGPVSGASMNPARSLGPAMVFGCYDRVWIYIVAPILGAVSGAWVYNMVRYTDKPLREITKSGSFLKNVRISSSR